MQLTNKTKHEKTEYHQDRLRRKEHPEEYKHEEEPCFKTIGSNHKHYFGCRFRYKILLRFQWQKDTTLTAHLEKKLGKHFPNPNLLDTQYQLIEYFLCCDELELIP